MNQLERGLLLLCSDLGDETIRPLSFAQYRALRKKVREMGIGNSNPDKAVEPSDLVRLGYDQPAAYLRGPDLCRNRRHLSRHSGEPLPRLVTGLCPCRRF